MGDSMLKRTDAAEFTFLENSYLGEQMKKEQHYLEAGVSTVDFYST